MSRIASLLTAGAVLWAASAPAAGHDPQSEFETARKLQQADKAEEAFLAYAAIHLLKNSGHARE